MKGFELDTVLAPNAKPVQDLLPKMSPAMQAMERYRLQEAEAACYIRTPTQEQLTGRACSSHIVAKSATHTIDEAWTADP